MVSSLMQTDASLLDDTCWVRLYTLLQVVGSCCIRSHTTATLNCCVQLHVASNHDSPLQNLKSGLNVCSLHRGLGCICMAQKGHREITITFTFVKLKYSERQNSKEH